MQVEDALHGHPAVAEGLIAHCRETLAHDRCPTSIELRDGLPRTATGKLQTVRLRDPYRAGKERMVNG